MGKGDGFYLTADEWLENHDPELWKSGKPSPKLVEIAWEELGETSLLSDEELALLPWSDSEIPVGLFEEYTSKITELKSKLIIT